MAAADPKAHLNGHRPRPPAWVDAKHLVAEPEPEREWVIEGLLERQGRILLAGEEGSGKSLLALTVAVQAAAGITVLDRFGMELPQRVVYCDLEMARSSTRRRLRALSISAELEDQALELLLRPDGLDLGDRRERQGFMERLGQLKPDLVVLDPLYKLTLTDSSYERDIKPTLQFLDRIRLEYGSALLLVHHLRKRGQGEGSRGRDKSDVFGSSVLLRWPETVMLLREQTLKVAKDRDATFVDTRSFPVRRGGVWPISLYDPTLSQQSMVLNLLEEMGPMSGNEIFAELGGHRQSLLELLRQMKEEGRVSRRANKWAAV